jgi:hypothetical protein
MATTKPQKGKPAAPAPAAPSIKAKATTVVSNLPFLFSKDNYLIMIAGVVVVILGFVLMTGAANDNPAVFPKEEIYSFRRITLAPVVVMIGFLIEVYAILKRPKTA